MDVGAEYLSKNSLTPLLALSIENLASDFSLPGATKIMVYSSDKLLASLHSCLILSIPFSKSLAK